MPEGRTGAAEIPLAAWVAAGIGLVALIASATAPMARLAGDGPGSVASGIHGLLGTGLLLSSTVLAYLAVRMYSGQLQAWKHTRTLALAVPVLLAATLAYGNWTYVFYRAAEGPRDYFLANRPEMDTIFFEFKRFLALAALPVSVAAAAILRFHRDDLPTRTDLRQATAVLLCLAWGFVLVSYALGAAVTKARGL